MLALIDGDIVLHRCGYVSEVDPVEIALYRTNETLEGILKETESTEYEIYLSDTYDNNYRKALDSNYKANRTAPKPIHYRSIKEYLFSEWNSNLSLGMEADDSLAIRQTELDGVDCVICSIDKDLLQIPGTHYNFVKKEWKFVTELEGLRSFYKQLLTGDASDNVKGIRGIGPVRAANLLDHLQSEREFFTVVRDLYRDDERLLLNGRLLWIRRKDEELWNFPPEFIKQEQDQKLESMPTTQGEAILSTEPTGTEKVGLNVDGQLEEGSSLKMENGQV